MNKTELPSYINQDEIRSDISNEYLKNEIGENSENSLN
jgi:hypothetical protein